MGRERNINSSCFLASILVLLVLPGQVGAETDAFPVGEQSAVIDSLEELTERGKYFEAMVLLFSKNELESVAERLAAAKSAWALGLVDVARELWDEVFAQRQFQGIERSRAMLARSILELQESNYETARAFAETATQDIAPSDLRAQSWLVIAEALKAQGALSLAEGYYQRAVEEGGKKTANEAAYLLGECQFKLGLINDSRYTFASLETTSQYTPQAIRRLAEIDLAQRNYEGVLTWIEEGRESYPSEFSDGWTTYARVTALLELKRYEAAQAEVEGFRVKHTQKNTWFSLARAAVEAMHARKLYPEILEKGSGS